MANDNLIALRDKCREADLAFARLQAQQNSAQEALDNVVAQMRELGFDPDAEDLQAQMNNIVRDTQEVLTEVEERLAKAKEAMRASDAD